MLGTDLLCKMKSILSCDCLPDSGHLLFHSEAVIEDAEAILYVATIWGILEYNHSIRKRALAYTSFDGHVKFDRSPRKVMFAAKIPNHIQKWALLTMWTHHLSWWLVFTRILFKVPCGAKKMAPLVLFYLPTDGGPLPHFSGFWYLGVLKDRTLEVRLCDFKSLLFHLISGKLGKAHHLLSKLYFPELQNGIKIAVIPKDF